MRLARSPIRWMCSNNGARASSCAVTATVLRAKLLSDLPWPRPQHNATYLTSASIEVAAANVASCRRLDHVTLCASADSWPMIRGVPPGRGFGPLAPHPFDLSWL
jgi:hypothetical protein